MSSLIADIVKLESDAPSCSSPEIKVDALDAPSTSNFAIKSREALVNRRAAVAKKSAKLRNNMKKKKVTARKTKLKKPVTPAWDTEDFIHQHLSFTAPMTPNAKKSIEKWNLLAPYDSRITEEEWGTYYNDRCALEIMNTCGSEKWPKIESKELMQETETLLAKARRRIGAVILRSAGMDEEWKMAIAENMTKSLYYLELSGDEYDRSNVDTNRTKFAPISLQCKTRLYSPFGVSNCVDFCYKFHAPMQEDTAGTHAACVVSYSYLFNRNDGKRPPTCSAELREDPIQPAKHGFKLFNWDGKSTWGSMSSCEYLDSFHLYLFNCFGWLSRNLLYELLCAGSTAGVYQEPIQEQMREMQATHRKYEGET